MTVTGNDSLLSATLFCKSFFTLSFFTFFPFSIFTFLQVSADVTTEVFVCELNLLCLGK